MTLLEQALAAQHAGLCVMPPREDGSKAPMGTWEEYQKRTSSEEEVRRWYASDRGGLGVICGETSGFFEIMEFEGRAVAEGLWQAYKKAAEQDEQLWALLQRVMRGYGVQSPSGGIHLGWRCWEGVEKNRKLARRPATPEELEADPTEKVKVLIETRGEGGYIVTPPSNGRVHPSGGAYRWLAGGFESITEVSAEERNELLTLASSFDQMPQQEWEAPKPKEQARLEGRPGDDFNQRADWTQDILEPAGWSRTSRGAGREYWYRKRDGQQGWKSASISADGRWLYVFSTSTELPSEVGLSKFRAYAFLHHSGDFAAASAELRRRGYGEERASGKSRTASSEGSDEGGETVELIENPELPWPEPPAEAAWHGLPGRLTALISPYVESDRCSTLAQFLVAFGIAVGTQPHFMVGATRHAPATYLGLVGRTSRARKGTSWDPIRSLFRGADESLGSRIMSGLGSGERLVWLVRDPRYELKDGVQQLAEPGAEDRRLLLQEPELARLLTVVNREGSTMSAVLRVAYDGQALRNEVKTNGSVATIHHVGMVGHCTAEDLTGLLKEQEIRNGLANRVLWVAARREKKLPDPPVFEGPGVEAAITELRSTLARARTVARMRRHTAAQRLWEEWYLSLPDDESGLLGAVTNRAEAQVIRLSMIYALTDGVELIGVDHLRAAIAFWEFSARCAAYVFGAGTGNQEADRILEELRRGPRLKTEIVHDVFHGNVSASVLLKAQKVLERRGVLRRELVHGSRGRPPERWSLKENDIGTT